MCVIYVQTASICNQSQLSNSIRSKMTIRQRWKGQTRFFEVKWFLSDIFPELTFFGKQRYDFAIMGPILLKIAFNELFKAIFGFWFAFLVKKPHRFFMFHLACKTLYLVKKTKLTVKKSRASMEISASTPTFTSSSTSIFAFYNTTKNPCHSEIWIICTKKALHHKKPCPSG